MAGFQSVEIGRGNVIFAEGSNGDFAYVIESGRVLISIERDDQVIEIAVLGPNEIFGEMAIISTGKRSATATALEDCRLQRIEKLQFSRRLDSIDPVMRMLVDVLLSRLRSTLQSFNPEPNRLPSENLNVSPLTPPPMVTEAMGLLRLENDISRAIRRKELALDYQPIVCLATGKLAGFEGLIRWHHPERGIIPPDLFVPLAEQSRLISGITQFSLDQACNDLPEMRIAALQNIENVLSPFVGINITQTDLNDPHFYQNLEQALTLDGLTPDALKLEITETSLMTNISEVCSSLAKLKKIGIRVAIDDFGTGYSSMSYLSKLPVATLKIDKSFIVAMSECEQNRKIVNGILKLAQELGICVIAEGIEFNSDVEYLAMNKCDLGQGFFYSKPVGFECALAMIRNWRALPYSIDRDGGTRSSQIQSRAIDSFSGR